MEGQSGRCKIVVVGDAECGKTALLQVFAKDAYPGVRNRRLVWGALRPREWVTGAWGTNGNGCWGNQGSRERGLEDWGRRWVFWKDCRGLGWEELGSRVR